MDIPNPEEPNQAAAAETKRKGDVAFVAHSYDEALLAYSQSLRHDTSSPVVWANRSATHLKLDQAQKALSDARIARTIDETYTKVGCKKSNTSAATHVVSCCLIVHCEHAGEQTVTQQS